MSGGLMSRGAMSVSRVRTADDAASMADALAWIV